MKTFEINDIQDWLRSKHCTMWGGEGWTITKEDTCRKAAEWFVSQINEFQHWRAKEYCEECGDIDLIDALAVNLVTVIGQYVPVEEQEQWNDLLMQYVQYKEIDNV